MSEIILVHGGGGDWEGIYVDGQLKAENHSLDPVDIIRALGLDAPSVEVDENWIQEEFAGRLPNNYELIPQSAILSTWWPNGEREGGF